MVNKILVWLTTLFVVILWIYRFNYLLKKKIFWIISLLWIGFILVFPFKVWANGALGTISATTNYRNFKGLSLDTYLESDDGGKKIQKYILGYGYGITEDFTLKIHFPFYIHKKSSEGESEGIGDTVVLGKYQFYQKDILGGTDRASILGGISLPTGEDDKTSNGKTLSVPMQPGSGAFSYILGGAYTWSRGQHNLHTNILWEYSEEANDFQFGQEIHLNLAYVYRQEFGRYYPSPNLFYQLSVLTEYEDKNKMSGIEKETGGTTIYLLPGIRYTPTPQWGMGIGIKLPIYENLRKEEEGEKFEIISSIMYQW